MPCPTHDGNFLETLFFGLPNGFAHEGFAQQSFGTFHAQPFLPQGGHHLQYGIKNGIVVAVGFKGVFPPTLAVVVTRQGSEVVHGVAQH